MSLEFFIDIILPASLGLTQPVTEMSQGGQCIGLTTLRPSFADCLEIWVPQPPGILRACPGL